MGLLGDKERCGMCKDGKCKLCDDVLWKMCIFGNTVESLLVIEEYYWD